jgi:hypothetical protein
LLQDDGSQFYNDTGNVMLWGGCKNYMGHSKLCVNNFILYPGCSIRSEGGHVCQTDDSGDYANSVFSGNQCVVNDGVTYDSRSCVKPYNSTFYATANNHLFTTSGSWSMPVCNLTSFAPWQAAGKDPGSDVATVPATTTLLEMAKGVLEG